MYLSRFFAKKHMKLVIVDQKNSEHAVDLCSTVSRKANLVYMKKLDNQPSKKHYFQENEMCMRHAGN